MQAAIELARERFGGIDVLVNNPGYGYIGAIEAGEDAEVRALFETNVFRVRSLTRAVLPGMRERGSGYIVNVGSIGGLTTFPAVGFYPMTKFALEGLSETLAKEVASLGIDVMVAEPGAFRTGFRGRSMKQSSICLPAYESSAGRTRDNPVAAHGTQQMLSILHGGRSRICSMTSTCGKN